MEPVVYDFAINRRAAPSPSFWCGDRERSCPAAYYAMDDARIGCAPIHSRLSQAPCKPGRDGSSRRRPPAATHPELSGMVHTLFDRLFPRAQTAAAPERPSGPGRTLLAGETVSTREQHEKIRADHQATAASAKRKTACHSSNTIIEDVKDQPTSST